ncbi:MFS transporter [Ornithinimicrobium murale]|uniref:MFS transporter n=1 Tax=Ornithinimicrobium murale TaxID=1050153 RepID=UPI0013B4773A|nr:MFS transporter [Ornithinimicrobium murale]
MFSAAGFVSLLLVSGMNLLTPILPLYAQEFDATSTEIGVVVGSFAIGRVLFDVAGGSWSDRYGPRSIALTGCLVTAGGSVIAGATNSLSVLIAARAVQGVGSALYVTSAMLLVIAIAPRDKIGQRISQYQGIFIIGLAIGPIVGGVTADAFGMRAPFYAYAGIAVVGFIIVAITFPSLNEVPRNREAVHARGPRTSKKVLLRRLLAHPVFIAALLVTFTVSLVRAGIRNTILPLYAGDVIEMSTSSIGALLTVSALGNLLALWGAGRLLDGGRRKATTVISLLLSGCTVGLFAITQEELWLFVLAGMLGAFTGYATAAPTAGVVDAAEEEVRGTAVGVQRMAMDVGLLLGPIALSTLLPTTGFSAVFLIAASLLVMVAFVAIAIRETKVPVIA